MKNGTGMPFTPGMYPTAAQAPRSGPDAVYSGLLECPCTDRITTALGHNSGAPVAQVAGTCTDQVDTATSCEVRHFSLFPVCVYLCVCVSRRLCFSGGWVGPGGGDARAGLCEEERICLQLRRAARRVPGRLRRRQPDHRLAVTGGSAGLVLCAQRLHRIAVLEKG